jgi:hypothetical protein
MTLQEPACSNVGTGEDVADLNLRACSVDHLPSAYVDADVMDRGIEED